MGYYYQPRTTEQLCDDLKEAIHKNNEYYVNRLITLEKEIDKLKNKRKVKSMTRDELIELVNNSDKLPNPYDQLAIVNLIDKIDKLDKVLILKSKLFDVIAEELAQ